MDLLPPRIINDVSRPALAGGRPIRQSERYLTFGRPQILEEDVEAVARTLRSGWIGTGPQTTRFEAAFAEYVGAGYGVALSSCTTALRLSMLALGVGPGDEVITTALTFCATVNSIIHSGARPVLADCLPGTMNLDPADVVRKLTPRTRGILPVHFAGRLCNMEALVSVAKTHGLVLVEDCAHAIETTGHDGRHAGTYGDLGAFSFYATKNVTTAEGGMMVTSDKAIADRLRILALHGMSKDAWKRYSDSGYRHYDIVELGYKGNMTDIQASLGLGQLARVERNLLTREEIWRRYDDALLDLPIELPAPVERGTRHARHLYTILIPERSGPDRDLVLAALHAEGIGAGVHYQPISGYSYYQNTLGVKLGDFPNAESIGRRTLSLPLSAGMTGDDVEDVVAALRRILEWEPW